MRAWLSMAAGRSAAGEWILNQKVFPKLNAKDHKLRAALKAGRKIQRVHVGDAAPLVLTLEYPKEPVQRFMIRCTKGLLRNIYPHYDYSKDKFRVFVPSRSNQIMDEIQRLVRMSKHLTRGNEEFDCWHSLAVDAQAGSWVLLFYGSALCMVLHSPLFENQPS